MGWDPHVQERVAIQSRRDESRQRHTVPADRQQTQGQSSGASNKILLVAGFLFVFVAAVTLTVLLT